MDRFPSWIQLMHDLANREAYFEFRREDRMACACHVCRRTGIRTCDPEEAAIKCHICGFCDAEKERLEREAVKNVLQK
jgi:hypothetical protein